jgi:hypothetical protein
MLKGINYRICFSIMTSCPIRKKAKTLSLSDSKFSKLTHKTIKNVRSLFVPKLVP